MHDIIFYSDRRGKAPVEELIHKLSASKGKDSRINLNKILDYIDALAENGTDLPEKYCKHLQGDIWELRPINNRVLFAGWVDNSFVRLHPFVKKTQKTPQREIDKAQRELDDFRERWDSLNGDCKRL